MIKVHIQYQDQFKKWKHYQTKHHAADAYRTAENRSKRTGLRHRLVDDDGRVLDLIEV